ncbi:DUF2058 domain-containing protein [Steroidobacter sp. S1-65]|uniref:DUF2058 domain-containing protein n=1 Tax=Steroidobacter gossypii TaxID=2805490 RepID=A0ABS1WRS1_9GAMM|nr:DUF2058 domain-containing protein [Steroidobacter gossypii]MBM0103672.1 DUF2058 domain-containing protein [Steroidobacter gossypii]
MSMSLREQLLAAGLGSKKQARQVEQQQKQQQHQQAKNRQLREEQEKRAAEARAKAQAEKAARDAELNRKRQENQERKERWAQIKQIIEQHRLPKPDSDEYFNFIDRGKVRRITADNALREKLMGGSIAIARCEGRYDLVPAEIAERLRERDERSVVKLNQEESKPAEDDPYKDFVVPDDLMW